MALSPAERAEVEQRIFHFLQVDFFETLTRYYAEGVAYSSKHPQNINNELRNAITHMARAVAGDDIHSSRDELDAADRHVERFKRDCLKVAVYYASKDASNLIRHAYKRYKNVDPNLSLWASQIVRTRVAATLKEAVGDDQSVETWEAIFRDIGKLRERLYDTYPALDPQKHWFPLWVYEWFDYFKSASAAIIIGIVSVIILSLIIPDQTKWAEHTRHAIAEFISPATCTNPSGKLAESVGKQAHHC